jgi:hypothetical protein
MTRPAVLDVAVFFDCLSARAAIDLVADLDVLQAPFGTGSLKMF